MTKELQDRLVGILRRVCARGFRVIEDVTSAGGQVVAGATWGRSVAVRSLLESAAKELREIANLVEAAARLVDEPNEEKGAA